MVDAANQNISGILARNTRRDGAAAFRPLRRAIEQLPRGILREELSNYAKVAAEIDAGTKTGADAELGAVLKRLHLRAVVTALLSAAATDRIELAEGGARAPKLAALGSTDRSILGLLKQAEMLVLCRMAGVASEDTPALRELALTLSDWNLLQASRDLREAQKAQQLRKDATLRRDYEGLKKAFSVHELVRSNLAR